MAVLKGQLALRGYHEKRGTNERLPVTYIVEWADLPDGKPQPANKTVDSQYDFVLQALNFTCADPAAFVPLKVQIGDEKNTVLFREPAYIGAVATRDNPGLPAMLPVEKRFNAKGEIRVSFQA